MDLAHVESETHREGNSRERDGDYDDRNQTVIPEDENAMAQCSLPYFPDDDDGEGSMPSVLSTPRGA